MYLEDLYSEFLEYMKSEKDASKLTIEAYKRDFNISLDFLAINKIEPNLSNMRTPIIRKYIYYMNSVKKYTSTTLCRRINSLRSFFKFVLSQEYIDKNPMNPITTP
ncbi:tyrosine-type recombinase/integrase [Tepidibacter formicigenes]|jgi:site-specific recombinase XerD|uniref:Phage integrase, N-terminal SAM-like domain n=1 Tax=Tepidibacter formicigenes DSM 15518 TaxID=1123349 RepID=A0A1M6QS99_9FIRM|nr:site-specific integrase [Tepidibacter formicigenes]SHK23162.1 Phage integrase, N-terminal SAM-like domain [Tepidibacter formicigenes DSM 15518]